MGGAGFPTHRHIPRLQWVEVVAELGCFDRPALPGFMKVTHGHTTDSRDSTDKHPIEQTEAPTLRGRVGAEMSKEERELVIPLGALALIVVGVWLWWRRR